MAKIKGISISKKKQYLYWSSALSLFRKTTRCPALLSLWLVNFQSQRRFPEVIQEANFTHICFSKHDLFKQSLHEHTQGCFVGASHNVCVNYLLGRSLCFSHDCLVSSVFEHTEFYILAFVFSLKLTVQFNGVFGWVSFEGFHCSELG